ncbi:MAG: stage III sporulation AC/AD family protein [Eubacteriales bacterium]
MNELIKVLGTSMCAVAVIILLRQTKSDIAVIVALAAAIMITAFALSRVAGPIAELCASASQSISGEYMSALLKALAVCCVGGIAVDVCRDAGEGAIASRVELACRAELCVIAVPLAADILSLARSLII